MARILRDCYKTVSEEYLCYRDMSKMTETCRLHKNEMLILTIFVRICHSAGQKPAVC